MFEDRTFENIMSELMAEAPEGIDTRQGSIYYDAVAGAALKISAFYADLRYALDLVFITTAVGEYLDQKGAEYGVFRNAATPALYEYIYEGSRPSVGERFFAEGEYFVLRSLDGALRLEAIDAGQQGNSILPGTPAVPVSNINGLTSSIFGDMIEPGSDIEGDESYRQRIREKIGGPAENGNRQHYKTWCEEIAGVGRARIIPLFAGENTVMGVLIGADAYPAADTLVQRVQEYVDPITRNIEKEYRGRVIIVGDGLGNGKANVGAHFAAVAAEELPITVSFNAVLTSGSSIEQVEEEATKAIKEYLKGLALDTPESEKIVIRISAVSALIYDLPSIIDYTNLTFNGEAANIEVDSVGVAVLEEVIVHETVR